MIRSMDHNEEQIVWAEQTEIELQNFLKEFDATVWPLIQSFGYSKDAALNYWISTHLHARLQEIIGALMPEQYE